MKIMSYNIQHGVGDDSILNLERLGNFVRTSGANIVGLQEVDNNWSERSDFVAQAKWISDFLQMEYVYGANLNLTPLAEGEASRQYGLSIISNYPILNHKHYFLTSGSEQRGLLEATIDVNGNHYYLFNAHLGLNQQEREIQMKEILDITSQYNDKKIIVGDFNAIPGEVVPMMEGQFKDVFIQNTQVLTFPSNVPQKQIDYIFVSKDVITTNARVEESLASDHLPITVEIELEGT
jgi:endonuclease/exonuclease/phosphatase family metal-dependent hydrolase